MRTLRAFAWLRFRLLANSLRGSERRDTLERVSRTLTLMLPIAVAALSIGSMLALSILGFIGGRLMASGSIEPTRIMMIVRPLLAVITAVVFIFAVSSPGQSAMARYTRLLLLPISRGALHRLEFASSIADPWIVLLVPGLVSFAVGFASGGRLDVALAALAASAVFVLVLAGIGSVAAFTVGWLFRSRRRSEMLTLVAVLGISFVSLVPAFFAQQIEDRKRTDDRTAEERSREDFARLLWWTRGIPSQLHGDVIRAALDGRRGDAGLAFALLGVQAAALFGLSSAIHARLVGSVEDRGTRRRTGEAAGLTPIVPGASAATSAVAAAQFRTALRSVRGRLIVLLPGPLLAILSLAFRAIPDEAPWLAATQGHGHLLAGLGIVFSIYALQAFSMNLFASDRAGLSAQFLAPIDEVALARGKVIGVGLMLATASALCVVAAALVTRSGSPALWVAVLLGGLATYLVLSPAMVWFSAVFPVASDLSKTGSGGNPHSIAMLAGTLLTAIAAAPSALIVLAAEFRLDRPWLGLAVMVAWAGFAWVASSPFLAWTARAVAMRRENLALVAQGR
jgi:hypothetical protein